MDDIRFQEDKYVDDARKTKHRLIGENSIDNFINNIVLLQQWKQKLKPIQYTTRPHK